MFITIEGGEGAGKTTLLRKLKAELEKNGKTVVTTREPGGTPLGEHVRNCLLNPDFGISYGPQAELMLFLAARVEHIEEVIAPTLDRGDVVLCDRFNDSSIAYQGAGRGLGVDYVRRLCHLACGGLEPDLTFFLDLDPNIGMGRLQRPRDRLEGEELEFHAKVRKAYLAIANKEPSRVHVIDASRRENAVFEDVLKIIIASLS